MTLIASLGIGLLGVSGALAQNAVTQMAEAIRNDDLQTVKTLIEQGADPNIGQFGYPPINTASVQGRAEIVEYLLEQGVDPLQYDNNLAPIHLAASNDHVDVVQVFLEAGVPMDLPTQEAWAPPLMMQATRNNSMNTVRFLLDQGADINVRDKCNDPPIAAAAYYGYIEATKFYIEQGADLTTRSEHGGTVCVPGSTAISYALKQGHDEIAEVLREAGAAE